MTRSISSIAISGFIRTRCCSRGTRARAMRSISPVQLSGRKRRRPTITGTSRQARATDTSDGQLDVLPSNEAYCGATPTEYPENQDGERAKGPTGNGRSMSEPLTERLPFGFAVSLLPGLFRDRLRVLERIRERGGPVARLALGPMRLVFVSSPRVADRILHKVDMFGDKGLGLAEARHYLGEGRLSAGRNWHRSQGMEIYRPVDAEIALRTLFDHVSGKARHSMQPQAAIADAVLAAVLNVLLGGSESAKVDRRELRGLLVQLQTWSSHMLSLPLPQAGSVGWAVAPLARHAYHRLERLIERWRKVGEGTISGLAGCSPELARDEVVTLLVAGSETSAAAVSWGLDDAARGPRYDTALPPSARVAESLRLHPPVWALTRSVAESGEVCGYRFEAGEQVLIDLHSLHRDSNVWPAPNLYRPERFLESLPDGAVYLPFGGGPRQCIGRRSGLTLATALLSMLLNRFRIDPMGPIPRARAGLVQQPWPPPAYRFEARSTTQ